jgi:hypothetical protein
MGFTISMTWKTTVATNIIRSGRIAASARDSIFLDRYEETLMISLDVRSVTNRMAIKAPPTPAPTTAVIDTVLVAAVVVITKLIAFLSENQC